MRNSERIGYREGSKRHFLKINNCDDITFAGHYAEAQLLFDERNQVERWKIKADLDKFGGKGLEIQERNIPKILSPYESVDWDTAEHIRTAADKVDSIKAELSESYVTVLLAEEDKDGGGLRYALKTGPKYFLARTQNYIGAPKIRSIAVDNYQGTITVDSYDANKIEWLMDGEIIKTKYNIVGNFITTFSVEDLNGSNIQFRLIGDGGQACSQIFKLAKIC